MEEMGGLIKRMPWTALFFLIGAAAISALPPLNGFVSECSFSNLCRRNKYLYRIRHSCRWRLACWR